MRSLVIAAVLSIGLAAQSAAAAMVYRWTDANGVVHFSDVPPPHAAQMQTQTLPDPPPAEAAPPPDVAASGAPAGGAEAQDGKGAAGPARVVLTDHKEEPVAPGAQAFRGTVKNQGGSEARDVYVAVVVTEPTQGDQCLREEIDVQPATLAPGASGTYEAEFDNPCFHGPTSADLRPEWR